METFNNKKYSSKVVFDEKRNIEKYFNMGEDV